MTGLTLETLSGTFAVSKLPAGLPIPEWATRGFVSSVTRTPDELSVVCAEENVPADATSERGWRCLRVAGPLAFSLIGILTSLLEPLAEAGIPVFVISTFDTDHVLVKAGELERAVRAIEGAGHHVKWDDDTENA
jgi:hypothetical protein